MGIYSLCAKIDKCKYGRNCPYEEHALTGFLCFEARKYNRSAETRRTRTIQRIKSICEKSVTDQALIALNCFCNNYSDIKKLSSDTGIAVETIERYLSGDFPAVLSKMENLLRAAGYKLEVKPIGDARKDGNNGDNVRLCKK